MNLSDLLKEGKIKKVEPDAKQAEELMKRAERDVIAAKQMEDNDWAFAIAYNAMLQSARALMFKDGYKAVGEEHHKKVVQYADAKLGAKYRETIELFDKMRAKRHVVIYEKSDVISSYEAKFAIKTAEEFLKRIKEKM